jgi:hypothetical protein
MTLSNAIVLKENGVVVETMFARYISKISDVIYI